MGLGDRLRAMAALGSGELRGAYRERKRTIRLEADHKRLKAKTRIEVARIKAMEAKEMADLETAMYNAQIAAMRAKEQAKRVRHTAGVYTPRERIGKLARGAAHIGGAFYRGLTAPNGSTRRRSTKRRHR